MASSQDIRRWAAENGYDLAPKGPPTKLVREAYQQAHDAATSDDTTTPVDVEGQAEQPPTDSDPYPQVSADQPTDAPPPTSDTERPPVLRRPTWRDRLRGGKSPAVPGQRHPRASQEKLIGGVWTLLGKWLEKQGVVPTGRLLRMQAPVVGAVVDGQLRGTKVDTVLQPVARFVNKGSAIGSLIALPVMVQVVCMSEDPQGTYLDLEDEMIDAMYDYLEIAGPELEKRRKRIERRVRQSGGEDARALLATIFAGYNVGPNWTPGTVDATA